MTVSMRIVPHPGRQTENGKESPPARLHQYIGASSQFDDITLLA